MSRPSCSLLAVLACASCGDNAGDGGADAAVSGDTAAASCSAAFSGDFVEVSTGPGRCATLTGDALAFRIPSQTLAAPLVISIALSSPPTPGAYSAEDTPTWSAVATSSLNSGCVYAAGSDEAPNGSFALSLATIDSRAGTAHGTLTVQQYVHAFVLEDCGPSAMEVVELAF